MIRKLSFFVCSFLLISLNVFADDGFVENLKNFISLPSVTLTQNFAIHSLGTLFGSKITGADIVGSPIISRIFEIFNIGIISIVALLLSYTTSTTILNTAGEGSFMGQKMQSSYFFTVMRISLGSAALFPAVGGYSLMQVMLMSTIVQGSTFADILWQSIVNYTNAGTGLLSIPAGYDVSSKPDYIAQFMKTSSANQVTNAVVYNSSMGLSYQGFLDIYNGLVCHQVKNVGAVILPSVSFNSSGVLTIPNCMTANVSRDYVNIANSTLSVLMAISYNYKAVYNTDTFSSNTGVVSSVIQLLAQQASIFSNGVETFQALKYAGTNNTSKIINKYGWMNAGSHYIQIEDMAGVESSFRLSPFTVQVTLDSKADYGSFRILPTPTQTSNMLALYARPTAASGVSISSDATNLGNYIDQTVNAMFPGNAPTASQIASHTPSVSMALSPMSSYGPINENYAFLIKNSINSWKETFVNNPGRLYKMPITRMRVFGNNLIEYSVQFFEAMTSDVFSLAIASSYTMMMSTFVASTVGNIISAIGARLSITGNNMLMSCFGARPLPFLGGMPCIIILIIFFPLLLSAIIGTIVSAIGTGMMFAGVAFSLLPPLLHTLFMISIQNKLVYVSLAMAIAAPLMALGGSIAFYVPYVPVLAYTLATITWIISVVEVMVAVPIIMLGVTYPQGHDLLGKAEQGAMLFFSVFLRPSLIVIGFMFSVMTVGVMMIIASVTIHPVMLQLFQNVGGMAEIGGVTKVVFILMTMIVYAIMLLNSVDYAFGFVFKLPATVMKWIGLPEIQAQEEQYMQEIRQGSSGTASELSNAAGGMTSGLQDKAIGLQKKV